MWWAASEFAHGNRTHNDELAFLLREGVIRARKGYQSVLGAYQRHNRALTALREQGSIDTLADIQVHPAFTTSIEPKTASAPVLIVTDKASASKTEAQGGEDEQMDLFAA